MNILNSTALFEGLEKTDFFCKVNPFHATGLFCTPWKHEKTLVFVMFSGGIETDQRHKMG